MHIHQARIKWKVEWANVHATMCCLYHQRRRWGHCKYMETAAVINSERNRLGRKLIETARRGSARWHARSRKSLFAYSILKNKSHRPNGGEVRTSATSNSKTLVPSYPTTLQVPAIWLCKLRTVKTNRPVVTGTTIHTGTFAARPMPATCRPVTPALKPHLPAHSPTF